jgi:hypothetical protein
MYLCGKTIHYLGVKAGFQISPGHATGEYRRNPEIVPNVREPSEESYGRCGLPSQAEGRKDGHRRQLNLTQFGARVVPATTDGASRRVR